MITGGAVKMSDNASGGLDMKDNILLMVEVLVIEEPNQSFITGLRVLHNQHD